VQESTRFPVRIAGLHNHDRPTARAEAPGRHDRPLSVVDGRTGKFPRNIIVERKVASLTMSNADKLPRSVFAIDRAGSSHSVLYGCEGVLDLAASDGRVRWTPSGG
jgi:hypothetical protein